MAVTELDGLITRTTVILKKPADCEEWTFYEMIVRTGITFG
jgi:hypothetical protein